MSQKKSTATKKTTSAPKTMLKKNGTKKNTTAKKTKVAKTKTDTKVSYLQEKSPRIQERTVGMEAFLNSLGKRLGNIETQFEKSLKNLSHELQERGLSPEQLEKKLQQQIKEAREEFGEQIEEISEALEQNLADKLSSKTISHLTQKNSGKPPKSKPTSLLGHLFNLMPSLPNLFSSEDAAKRFEEIYQEDIDAFGRDPNFEEFVKPLFNFFYYKYWRIKTHGLENIPAKGRGLLVGNHSGTLAYDGSMIRVAVSNEHPAGRDVRFLVEDFVYYLPFIGTFMYRVGGVRASRDNAEQLLNSDHLVAVFPEGVKGIGKYYSQRYHLQRFGRGGFIKLAIRTKSPIIPVAVIGAEEIHPILYKSSLLAKPLGIPYLPITPTLPLLGPLGLVPFPSKWSLYFGEPIDFSHYKESTLKDELQIHKLSEMVREKIQTMVTEGLKKRRSVWFG